MYRSLLESMLLFALAGLGLADAWRLSDAIRVGGAFHDVIGPDRYLGFISAGLLICGGCYLVAASKEKRPLSAKSETAEGSQSYLVVLVAFLLVAYILAIPILGYLIATSFFFPVIYFIFGVRPWSKSVIVGLITAAVFYAIFAYVAEMPLPKGLLEDIL